MERWEKLHGKRYSTGICYGGKLEANNHVASTTMSVNENASPVRDIELLRMHKIYVVSVRSYIRRSAMQRRFR
jgi:hypothetical protein